MTKTLNVAMIGGGFMGKAHALAYAAMPMFFWPAPAIPVRKVVVDVTEGQAEDGRRRYGFEESSADWRAVDVVPEATGSRFTTSAPRTTATPLSPSRPPRPASISSARSRSPAAARKRKPCSTP